MASRRLFLAAAATGALLPALAATPAQAAVALLGTRSVSLLADHDRIPVGLLRGLFTRIQLRVSGNGIFMYDLRVAFLNGDVADIPVRFLIAPGFPTRWINLPGTVRLIRHIDMTYRRTLLGGQAVVSVYGERP